MSASTSSENAAKRPAPKPVYREQYGLIIICSDERDQQQLYKRLLQLGLRPRVVTT